MARLCVNWEKLAICLHIRVCFSVLHVVCYMSPLATHMPLCPFTHHLCPLMHPLCCPPLLQLLSPRACQLLWVGRAGPHHTQLQMLAHP
jgi:hypothetical protein